MRVLYNCPERIFKRVFPFLSLVCAVLFTHAIGTFSIYAQGTPLRTTDWTLPFKPCGGTISSRTDIKQIASDNEGNLYITDSKGTLESIKIPLETSNSTDNSNETNNTGNTSKIWEYTSNWQITLGSEIISNIGTDEKNIYVASRSIQVDEPAKLRAISKLTGITNWQTELYKTDRVTLLKFKYLYVIAGGYLLVIDVDTGSKLGETFENFDMLSKSFVYSTNRNEAPSNKSIVSNISLTKKADIDPKDVTRLTENRKTVFIGSKNGDLQVFDRIKSKRLWNGKVGGEITSIIFFEPDKILVGSMDNFLYMFSADKGNLIWKRRLANRLTEKPLIIDKIAFIANNGNSLASIIDLTDGKVINRISLPESHYFTANSLFINDRALISTNRGILLYSRNLC